jgi:hypothetical protein
LHNQLLDKKLSVILLGPILVSQLLIFLQKRPILIVDSLSNVSNKLEMMLELILSIL